MDKRVNDILNVTESVSVLMGVVCLITAALLRSASISQFNIVLLILGLLVEVIMVSIELFLFLNMKLKYKFTYILYLLVDLIFTLIVNEIFPFMGLAIIATFAIAKGFLRIKFMDAIYIPKKLKEYLKMFHITLPKKKKKKVAKKVSTVKKQTKKATTVKAKTTKNTKSVKTTKKKTTTSPTRKNKKSESFA